MERSSKGHSIQIVQGQPRRSTAGDGVTRVDRVLVDGKPLKGGIIHTRPERGQQWRVCTWYSKDGEFRSVPQEDVAWLAEQNGVEVMSDGR